MRLMARQVEVELHHLLMYKQMIKSPKARAEMISFCNVFSAMFILTYI